MIDPCLLANTRRGQCENLHTLVNTPVSDTAEHVIYNFICVLSFTRECLTTIINAHSDYHENS